MDEGEKKNGEMGSLCWSLPFIFSIQVRSGKEAWYNEVLVTAHTKS